MKQKTGKGKQWFVLPVVLLFLYACGTQKQTVEMSSEVYELPQNCGELIVTADIGSVFIQKGEKAELKTEHVVSQWLTVTEENGIVTVSYIPPDEEEVEGMETDSHHLTLTLPKDWTLEKTSLTAGTGPFYVDGAEAKELLLHQGTGQMMLKHVTAENLELECGGGLAEGEYLQVAKKLTIHGGMGDVDFAGSLGDEIQLDGGTGKIFLTMPETVEDYDISGSFFTRNVTVNGKTLEPEVSVEQNGGDLDSWEMDFDEDFTVPQQNTEGKKQIHIDGGTGEIALTFAGNTEKGGDSMIPRGVILDCCCVLMGANAGTLLRNKIPTKLQEPLMVIFGMCAIAIGMVSVIKLESLPAVLLALILGTIIGELADLDRRIKTGFLHGLHHLHFKIEGDKEIYMRFYLVVAVTLCASGTNIFGAFQEGATGDMTILMSKAVMDIFTAAIFAMALGFGMNLIVVPQFLILSLCFYAGKWMMSYLDPSAIQNFIAVGGLMTFILGLNIAKIKEVRAANLLPALAVVFPATAFFHLLGA